MYIGFDPKTRPSIKTDVDSLEIDRAFIAHFQVSAANAVTASSTAVLAATALTAAVQAITAGITSPVVPRNIKIIGNATGITGNVVVKGTNYNGDNITETIALNGITAVEGVKAFRTVTEIDLPVQTATGNTVSVGFGEKLGLPYKLVCNTILMAFLDNAKESTVPTVTTSSTVLENNTIKLNSSLSGKIVDVYLLV